MRRLLVLLLVVVTWFAIGPNQSQAADCGGSSTTSVTSDDDQNAVLASGEESAGSCGSDGGFVAAPTDNGPRDSDLDAICVSQAITLDRDPFEYCDLDADDPPEPTTGMISAAFQTIPLPPSQLIIQPPNGRTLVNFATNFYTDNGPFDVTPPLQLLGHTVELRVRPVTFAWHYGDGAIDETSEPGAAYPELRITHTYLQKGSVTPSVDTTYAATYRVDRAGPWLPVDGTVTIAGEPAQLQVLTATPTLVGYARG